MLKKTLTYSDFDGNEVTDTFYFNLTRAELTLMDLEVPGGWGNQLKAVVSGGKGVEIMKTFEDILRRTYGVRSADGKSFSKSVEHWENFRNTEAYSVLFMDLVSNAESAGDFLLGVIPSDLVQQAGGLDKVLEIANQQATGDAHDKAVEVSKEILNGQVITDEPVATDEAQVEALFNILQKDPSKMTKEELLTAFRAKNLLRG